MKRISFIIILVLAPFMLNAIVSPITPELLEEPSPRQELPDSNKGLQMNITSSEFEQSELKIELNIQNSSESMFGYGEFFYIEKKIEGMWYMLVFDDIVFTDFSAFDNYGKAISPGEIKTVKINLGDYSLSPDRGEYRIVKAFRYHGGTKVFWLTDEFKVI